MTSDPTPQVPDPNGPPVLPYCPPTVGRRAVKSILVASFGGTAAVASLFFLLVATPRATSGALRSTRLRWEQRQKEIAAAQETASDESADEPSQASQEPAHD